MNDKEIILEKTPLTKEGKYSYCPFCLEAYKRANREYKGELPKVIYIKRLIIYQTKEGERKATDSYYLCPACKTKITVDDYMNFYTLKTDGTRWKSQQQGQQNGESLARKLV